MSSRFPFFKDKTPTPTPEHIPTPTPHPDTAPAHHSTTPQTISEDSIEPIYAKEVTFNNFWSSDLRHQTETVTDQLELGLYSIKRYAFWLQKIVEIKRPALKESLKITEHETSSKTSKTSLDQTGKEFVSLGNLCLATVATNTDAETRLIDIIDRDVVQYILNWLKIAEKKLDSIKKDLSSMFAKQKEMLTRIAKARAEAHKQWVNLQAAWKESEKADAAKLTKKNGAKEFEDKFKKYQQLITKTSQFFNQFETDVKDANDEQQHYWNVALPASLKQLEELEVDRLSTWAVAMSNYRNAQHTYFVSAISALQPIDPALEKLDGTSDVKFWTNQMLSQHGLPVAPATIEEFLPCSYHNVRLGDDLIPLLSIDLSVALQQREREQNRNVVHTLQPLQASVSFAIPTANSNPSSQRDNVVVALPPNAIIPAQAHAVAYVLYDYPRVDNDDLELKRGEFVALLDMPQPAASGEESTWWIATKFDPNTGKFTGNKGIIPSNYVLVE